MPPPATIQRCKQCQQKIAEVERTLSSGDRNVLMSEYNFMFERSRDAFQRKIIYSVPVLNRKSDFGVSI